MITLRGFLVRDEEQCVRRGTEGVILFEKCSFWTGNEKGVY